MATIQYSDMFTYDEYTFLMNNYTAIYSNVTLLKDMCGKKADAKLDEIHLDTRTGKFTVPPRHSTRAVETAAAKTLVEFKGVHTRFTDDEDLPNPLNPKKGRSYRTRATKESSWVTKDKPSDKGESSTQPNNISGMIGLRIYENKRRKLLRVESRDDLIAREIDNHLRKEMRAVKSDITMGPRGDLTFTFQTSSMECIPEMKTLTEFIVIGCRYYYSRLV